LSDVTPDSVSDPWIGLLVAGRYRVLDRVARGGMGAIYRAEQQPLGRVVALKTLLPHVAQSDQVAEQRFLREAATCARLTHPNTVTVFDYGTTEVAGHTSWYMVMEWVAGRTLSEVLRAEGPMRPSRALGIVAEIARGLREAHALGVIHRDLKPGNIMLLEGEGGEERVKVLDFGIAKNPHGGDETLTHTGTFVGSPRYMSPEQLQGEPVDARSDIYSLGCVLYEMLCGAPPFAEGDTVRILVAHLQQQPPPMATRARQVIAPAVEALVMSCLAKDRAERPEDMAALLRAIGTALDAGVDLGAAEHATVAQPTPSWKGTATGTATRPGGSFAASDPTRPLVMPTVEGTRPAAPRPGVSVPVEPAPEALPRGGTPWAWIAGVALLVAVVAVALALRGPHPVATPVPVAPPAAVAPSTAPSPGSPVAVPSGGGVAEGAERPSAPASKGSAAPAPRSAPVRPSPRPAPADDIRMER
jgi:serine/threonine-protein kinase